MLKEKTKNNVIKPIANTVGADATFRPQIKNISTKSTANIVGTGTLSLPKTKSAEAHSNLISNIQPLTSKTGITLIALIITIIVMLILVGVTISVALNGGLFNKANNAVELTQKEIEREELTEIALGTYDAEIGGIDEEQLLTKIENSKYKKSDEQEDDKLILDGSSGTTWEIDLGSAIVEEYKKLPNIYGVAYEASMGGATITMYILKNGLFIGMNDDATDVNAYADMTVSNNYIKPTRVTLGSIFTAYFSEDRQTLYMEGIEFHRNENKTYIYEPVYNAKLGLYENAFYYGGDSINDVISIFNGRIYANNGWTLMENYTDDTTKEELKFNKGPFNGHSQISDDGERITLDERVYTLIKN